MDKSQNTSEIISRLDLYLLMRNTDLSRSFISNAIKNGFVKVNNVVIIKSSHKVKLHDEVEFAFSDAKNLFQEADVENVIPNPSIHLNIFYEDDDLLVINKDSGIATHPSQGHLEDTLLNGVHAYLHSESSVSNLRKHMVHRLDKDTSGLIMFAKTSQMLWWLHKQFAERSITKKYYSLVFSNKKESLPFSFQISGYMERSRKENKHLFSAKYGRWSSTDFNIFNNYIYKDTNLMQYLSLVECLPKTGRTHQLRVHLKQNNTPIFGDVIYSSDKQQLIAQKISERNSTRNRLFLHAFSLSFKSYDGKNYDFNIDLNDDLKEIINKLDEVK